MIESKHLPREMNLKSTCEMKRTNGSTTRAERIKAERCKDIADKIHSFRQALIPFQRDFKQRSEFIVRESERWGRTLTQAYAEAGLEILAEVINFIPQIRAARSSVHMARKLLDFSGLLRSLGSASGKLIDGGRTARAIMIDVNNAKKDMDYFLVKIAEKESKIKELRQLQRRLKCSL